MYIGGVQILKSDVKKYRPCNGRAVSFAVLTFMLLFVTIAGILPNVDEEEKKIVFLLIAILSSLHVLFVLYSLLKLNSPVFLDGNKIVQKQFGKTISIDYAEITDIKLSFAYYIRASYAIKIYGNDKRIMFEITSKVFGEFMKHCSNIDAKSKIESLLKGEGI